MKPMSGETRHFVIDSQPRTGSTTLAKLLSCHPKVSCAIEPFHPLRGGGHLNTLAVNSGSVQLAMEFIWQRWTGFKHVWDAEGSFPFHDNAELNIKILEASPFVICLQRKNLLRRHVSALLSSHLRFWIGTRDEFLRRLHASPLPRLIPRLVEKAIHQERRADLRRLELIKSLGRDHIHLYYEDIFESEDSGSAVLSTLNSLFEALGHLPMSLHDYSQSEAIHLVNPELYRWSSTDVYELIPGAWEVEKELGCVETGRLFQ